MKRFTTIISLILVCSGTPALGMPKKKNQLAQKPAPVTAQNPLAGLIFSEECGNIEKIEKALGQPDGLKVIFEHKQNTTFPRERSIIAANALRKIALDTKKPSVICKCAANGLYTIASQFEDLYNEKISDLQSLSTIPTTELKETGDFLEVIIPQWNQTLLKNKQISENKKYKFIALFKTVINYDLTDTLCDNLLNGAQNITDLKSFIASGKAVPYTDYRSFSYSPKLIKAIYDTQYQRVTADQTLSHIKKEFYKNFIKSQLLDELDSLAAISMQKGAPYEKIVASAKSASKELALPYALTAARQLGHIELFTEAASYVAKQGNNSTALKTLLLSIVQDTETKRQLATAFLKPAQPASDQNAEPKKPNAVQAPYNMSVWQSALAYIKETTRGSFIENLVSSLPKEVAALSAKFWAQPFRDSIEGTKHGKRQTTHAPLMTVFKKLQGEIRVDPRLLNTVEQAADFDVGKTLD